MIELAPGIHSLGHGKGGRVHAFLVDTGGELSLVDTLFEDDARLVLQAIHELGRTPADLKRIAITHGHRSHLGGLADAQARERRDRLRASLGGRHRLAATGARRRSASCRSSR